MSASEHSSSQSSSKGSRAGRRRTNLTTAALFPVLKAVTTPYPWQLSALGFFIELLQPFSLALNPHTAGHITTWSILYFVQLPCWDGTYAKGLTYSQFLGFYWALSIICWIIIAAAAVSVEYTHYMATVVVKYFLKHIINLMTTVMVVPIAQLLMTTLVCQKPYGSSVSVAWLFTEQRCDETVHLVHYGISIALMIVWFVVAAVVTSCNFVADPEATGNFRRQAHPYVDLALLVYRVGICVSFHLFLSMNMASYYSFLVAVLSFSMSILYMVVLPYHERFVNQLSTVVYALVGWSATTVFIFDKIGGAYAIPFVQMGGFYATLTLGALAVGIAAYFLSAIRYSSQTDRLLKMCTVAGFVPLEENPFAVAAQQKNPELQPFPRNLPTSDFIFSPHRFVETDVIEEALRNDELQNELEDAPAQGGGDDVESKAINRMAGYIRRVQVVSPTVDVARFPTDAELSVRFLADWTMRTRAPPTPHMLGFACRVFAKFLLLFPDSPTAAIAYVRFLTVYAPSLSRMNLSVKLLDSIPNEMMCDLHHLYQVYLLTLSVKEVLGVRDKNHEKMYRRSRRLHKETLIQTASVWRSLLEDDRSLVSLCFLTNTLSDVRQKCADTYLQALNAATDDEILFRSFSNFADQVTQNKPCAALCITEAERVSKRRRARLLQRDEESTSGGESTARSGVSRAQKEEESQTVLRHIAESIDQQSETLSQNLSSTFVYTAAVVTFIILCGVVVADAAIVLSWLSKWPAETERSYHMGNVRTTAQNMLVRLYSVRGELPDDGTLSDTTAFRSEMAQLAAVGYAFEAAFNFLTYGEGKSTDAQMTAYIKEPSSIVKIFTTSTESILLTRDFWSMGSMLSERFATTLTYLQTIPTKAQFDSHPDVMFLVENIPNTYDIMFGRAVVEMHEAHVRYARSSSTVYGASLAVVVALLVVGAYIFLWNFRRSASTKVESLNLFHLIPSDSVKRLANDAKERFEKFVSGENMEKNTNDVANELSVGEAENNDTLSNEDTRRQSYSSKLLAHLFQSGGVETVESEGAGNTGATGGGTDAQFTSGTGPSKIVPLLGSDMDKDEPHHDRSLTESVSEKSSSDVFANDAKGASQSVSTRKRLSIVIGKGIDMGKVKRSSSILEMADPSVASEESPMERAEMEVHEAAVEEVDLDANSISRKSGITLPILLIVVALTVLFCVGIAECASLLQSYSDTNKSLEKIDSERLCADRIRLDSLQMLLYIQRYVISADYEDYQRFAASYLSFVASKEACLGSLPSLRNIDYAQYIDTLAMVQELSAISAALVSSNLADAVATTFHGIQWTAPSKTFDLFERYGESVDDIGAHWFPYTNTSYDQARPYAERVDLVDWASLSFARLLTRSDSSSMRLAIDL